jgi:hypothetical protein
MKAGKTFLREGIEMGMFAKEAGAHVDLLFTP